MKKTITALTMAMSFIGTSINAQTWQWAKGAGGTANETGTGVAVDASGNLYATGQFSSSSITFGSTTLTNHGGIDFYLVKYDASGNVLWAKGATGASNEGGNGITIDASGNVYVVGTFNSSTLTFGSTAITLHSYDDIFIVKYDASGNVLWAKDAGGAGNDIGSGISIDGTGNSYITGYFASSSIAFGSTTLTNTSGGTGSGGTNDFYIAKYDASGNALWAKSAGGTASDVGTGVTVDASGNSYATGQFSSSSITFGSTTLTNHGGIDFYLVKYDASGNVLWAKGATGASNEGGNGITIDASGNVYVVGTFNSSTLTFNSTAITLHSYDDIFIIKYDASGNVLWAKDAGGAGNDIGSGISIDGSGNSCITGYFSSATVVFGSTTLTNAGGASGSTGTNDIYIAQYDASGNAINAKSVSGSGDDRGNSVAVDGLGNAYVTGYFASSSIAFGSITLTNAGGNDIYIAKIGGIAEGIAQVNNPTTVSTSVFPNPNNGVFELQIKDVQNSNEKTEIVITDVLGREVYSSTTNLQNSGIKIDLSNQVTGIYYIIVNINGKQYRNKVIVSK